MIYRRFGYLQTRVLLDKQDKLRLLEDELTAFDCENEDCSASNQPNEEIEDVVKDRAELLERIDTGLSSYGKYTLHDLFEIPNVV